MTGTKIVKNKILLFVLAILIFIPSVVAIVYYASYDGSEEIAGVATHLNIHDPDGNTYSFEKDKSDNDNNMLDIFDKMRKGAEKKAGIPNSLNTAKYFTVTYSIDNKEVSFKFYLEGGADGAYYEDPDGNLFRINPEDAKLFLATPEAENIYSDSGRPVLKLSGKTTVFPTYANWQYKNITGEFKPADTSGDLASKEQHFDIDGGLNLVFTPIMPETINVTIDDGGAGYTGTYEKLPSYNFVPGSTVSVKIEASWSKEIKDRDFYGDITYEFKATIAEGAEFFPGIQAEVGENLHVNTGEFITVTGMNISSPEDITFTSEPPIDYNPVFVTDEDAPEYVRALIPFKVTLTPGIYTFTLGYGGVSQTMVIELVDRGVQTKPYKIGQAVIDSYYSEDTINAFNNTTSPIVKNVTSKKLWDDYFLQGKIENLTCGFGHIRTFGDESYNHPGVDYSSGAGNNVAASNSGTVVFAEPLLLTGYTVIIDHGFGLYTWYWHLSDIKVNVGDTVARGDTVGLSGGTGFTNQNGYHLGMSVGNVFVSPYPTWEDGAWKDVPFYTEAK